MNRQGNGNLRGPQRAASARGNGDKGAARLVAFSLLLALMVTILGVTFLPFAALFALVRFAPTIAATMKNPGESGTYNFFA